MMKSKWKAYKQLSKKNVCVHTCVYVCGNQRKLAPNTTFNPLNFQNYIILRTIYLVSWSLGKEICTHQYVSRD